MSKKTNVQELKEFPLNYFVILIGIFVIGLIIRFYYLPSEIPVVLDAESYFWYANDMSILKQIPINYSPHNNFWPSILSVFFIMNPSQEILDYMNMQRILSVIISSSIVFPMYFLCKKFFPAKYALLGASFFILDPRIIINSVIGITEPIYLLVGVTVILFSLNKNEKFQYISFGLAAIFSLIRYEGLLILIPLTISYFWKFRINQKSILKYILCTIIFVLVLLPMIETRIQATGQDGLTSHLSSKGDHAVNTISGTNEKIQSSEFVKNGVFNTIKFLGWITIPLWILLLPYGIWKYFKNLDFQKGSLLLFSIILILPAIYAYSRDISETRYLYILLPLFSVISLYSIKKITERRNYKTIASLILVIIIVMSIGWIEYKWIDKEYEKEVFELSFKIKETAEGVNEFYPESTYLKFIDKNEEFPKMKNQYEQYKMFSIINYKTIEEFIINERENGLTHIISDKSQNDKSQREEFLIQVFNDEEKYEYLKKVFDSKKNGFNYHMKIFEIDYDLFDEYMDLQ